MDRSAGRSPRGDATEMLVGRVAVPKTGQKNASPRENATEMLVGRVPVPKTGRRPLEEPTADPNRGRFRRGTAGRCPG
ncbi:MAG: hypothetical protein SPF15_07730 [Candidatus Cryptobacteroides sp.]|uniref:hypothetical protein n=1 Tax=Candidatus Cryptobacteroides sp. TaxID=2952915 RepID=UPI002A81C912|nr:hypothetical protein [Candidatus Cryptobacteroides sp.]MDY5043871.1 hypothetical protein [Candidatus Cryptobacteroides sp.]